MMVFFFWFKANETFEKLASMGLAANLTVYLKTKYNLNGIILVNVVNIWSGSCNITSIAGAIISDAYLGRFLTLLFGSISSFLGIGTITLTAAIDKLRPATCLHPPDCEEPFGWQLAVLFIGLTLLAIGAGGIRPCNIAFGADQFNTSTERGRAQLESFFNWWYLLFTVALLIALTVVVYVQTNISWAIGFAIPTACFACSIIIFLLGHPTYTLKKPQGSIFIDMAKVVSASIKKRNTDLKLATETCSIYNPISDQELGGEVTEKPVLTDRFKCFNKAAVITDPSELDDQGKPKNVWRLCSLNHVEQLKCFVGIIPVWCSGIGCFMVMDQQSTFGILQAIQMGKSLGPHFQIPPAWMGMSSMIALAIWILIYEQIYISYRKKHLKNDKRLSISARIKIGIVMSILCMLVAGIVEGKRRAVSRKHGTFTAPLGVEFLLPQFILSGLTEAFAAVAVMEFFTTRMPENMRSVAGSIFFLSLSIASYLNSLIVNIIHSVTGRKGKSPWLNGKDLNDERLDYYYYLIAGFAALNFLYFVFFSQKYVVSGTAIAISNEGVKKDTAAENKTTQDHMDNRSG